MNSSLWWARLGSNQRPADYEMARPNGWLQAFDHLDRQPATGCSPPIAHEFTVRLRPRRGTESVTN